MKRVLLVAVCMMGLLISVGCKKTTTSGDIGYSFLYTPGDHLEELVEAKKYDEASMVYNSEEMWFVERQDDQEIMSLLQVVYKELDAKYLTPLEQETSRVAAIQWPVERNQWKATKKTLDAFYVDIQKSASIRLFQAPGFKSDTIDKAKTTLASKRKQLIEYAPTALGKYQLTTDECFFEAYPVEVNGEQFVEVHAVVFQETITKAKGKELLHINEKYVDYLTSDLKTLLADEYFSAHCPSPEKADLKQLMAAYSKVNEAGLEIDSVPGVKISFLEVTSETPKDKGVIEFPVGVEMDMPFSATSAGLSKGFEHKDVKSADIVILFNLASTKTFRRVDSSNYVKSKFLAGHKQVNNPEWDVLQVELQQANMEIMTNSGGRLSTSTANPYTNLGNALANLGRDLQINEAKDKVEELKEKFRNTPRYIDEPVYEPYHFQRVEMEVEKTGTVQYYVIDQRRKTYYTDFFDIHSQEFFTVAYNVLDEDPDKEKHQTTNVTEVVVDEFEGEAISVKISELLDHYSKNKANHKRYASLSTIRKDVVKNRNVAVAKAKEKEYGFDKKKDKRFESVVVVQASNSLGTGFYVTSNLVLTNYHVVEEQKFVELKKWDEIETFGKVIAKDVRLDLALIKVQDRGLPVTFYSKKKLPVGETVEAIGHPKGHLFTLTRGVISTIRKHETVMGVKGKPVMFVQTDTPINSGNSGGPLFLGNQVVGVNDWGLSKQISEGLNFSIHYSEVFTFLDDNNVDYRKGK